MNAPRGVVVVRGGNGRFHFLDCQTQYPCLRLFYAVGVSRRFRQAKSFGGGCGHAQVFQRARLVALPISIILFAIFANYAYRVFTYTDIEVFRTWMTNRPTGYWTPFDIHTRRPLWAALQKWLEGDRRALCRWHP